ncbi:hypothetical protein [uncultured Shewanella sp.]|uniref:hypothetical protein n=1 Tax=uncultured Shewanella sp. TaxID=173975 RepID=UPI00260EC203|nr:hypothetical protein [uncultured Shewanella sp.]
MLAQSGLKRIVVAILDPDPRNNGKGVHILKEAGIQVDIGVGSKFVMGFLQHYLGYS